MAERRYRNSAERRTGDHFAAMESADAKQFHVMEAGPPGAPGPEPIGASWAIKSGGGGGASWPNAADSKKRPMLQEESLFDTNSHRVFSLFSPG